MKLKKITSLKSLLRFGTIKLKTRLFKAVYWRCGFFVLMSVRQSRTNVENVILLIMRQQEKVSCFRQLLLARLHWQIQELLHYSMALFPHEFFFQVHHHYRCQNLNKTSLKWENRRFLIILCSITLPIIIISKLMRRLNQLKF